jgi:hypothetical protein
VNRDDEALMQEQASFYSLEAQFPVGAEVICTGESTVVATGSRGLVDSYGLDMADRPVIWCTFGLLPSNHAVPLRPDQLSRSL